MKNSNGGQAMSEKYTDHISRNLTIALENRGLSIDELAREAKISHRTLRVHLKCSDSIKMSLMARYAHILRVGVTELTSRNWIERQNWTGVKSLDQVVSAYIRSENEPEYREEANRYIDDDYLSVSTHYEQNDKIDKMNKIKWIKLCSNPDLYGMDWETECRLNALSDDRGKSINTSKILCSYITTPRMVTLLREIYQTDNNAPSEDRVKERTITSLITLEFRHYFPESVEGKQPWLIRRKGWHMVSNSESVFERERYTRRANGYTNTEKSNKSG